MGDGIPLGRIAGIRVAASWTLLIVVALLVLGLAGGVFPREYPGLAAGWYLAAAAVGAALFLVPLLAHELTHALVARRACRPTTGRSRRPRLETDRPHALREAILSCRNGGTVSVIGSTVAWWTGSRWAR
jgi:Zn-dependent protease